MLLPLSEPLFASFFLLEGAPEPTVSTLILKWTLTPLSAPTLHTLATVIAEKSVGIAISVSAPTTRIKVPAVTIDVACLMLIVRVK